MQFKGHTLRPEQKWHFSFRKFVNYTMTLDFEYLHLYEMNFHVWSKKHRVKRFTVHMANDQL